ncbi:hypothetical protein DPMN_173262 [Dreissena polymorpha]|uniref:Uncharacterized protein n=1 Tax=Dreissena polymorpha TaxID=45954 RepID=A0A9D4IHE7_DREPO|nr:hypothetical protein DPMN_173262 [Dreissena polymorpha]
MNPRRLGETLTTLQLGNSRFSSATPAPARQLPLQLGNSRFSSATPASAWQLTLQLGNSVFRERFSSATPFLEHASAQQLRF